MLIIKLKNFIEIAISMLLVFSLVYIIGCEKENTPPTCKIISPSHGANYYVGELVTISVEAEDEDGTLEDGKIYINNFEVTSATKFPFNYDWDTEGEVDGIIKIKVRVKDDDGATAEDEISILLIPVGEAPVAAFTADKTTITEGESVLFTDQSSNEPTSWLWNFGDGGTSSQQIPSHTYFAAGIYTVSLQVSNQYDSDTETRTDYITVTENGEGETGSFTDTRDGKTYNWLKIGTQTWMAENLAYLPRVSPSYSSSNMDPYYYVYDYQGTNVTEAKTTENFKTYGVLYNWPAAIDACPSGWHLPNDSEWKTMEIYLGMSQEESDGTGWRGTYEGDKLKETGTTHWRSPNAGATNESGFTALPGGSVNSSGNFSGIGYYGSWWSATEYSSVYAWYRYITYDLSSVYRLYYSKDFGFSVRCLRDY